MRRHQFFTHMEDPGIYTYPYAPCMEYVPTLNHKFMVYSINIGKLVGGFNLFEKY